MTSTRSSVSASVLIVDDHVIFRAGLKAVIAGDSTLSVSGETGDPETAVALASSHLPAVILLDDTLDGVDGLQLVPTLRAAAPTAAIVLLSEMRTPDVRTRALRMGVKGVLSKGESGDVLLKAIRQIQRGELWFDRSTVSAAVSAMVSSARADGGASVVEPLTDREREIVALVGAGLKTEAIAERLSITPKTVRNQLTVIYEKLGVSDRLELAIHAYRHGLATLPS